VAQLLDSLLELVIIRDHRPILKTPLQVRLAADLLEEFHGLCVRDSILSGDKHIESILLAYLLFLPSRYWGRHILGQDSLLYSQPIPPQPIAVPFSLRAIKWKKKASYISILNICASCGLNYGIL
jgi:hypothetical protein